MNFSAGLRPSGKRELAGGEAPVAKKTGLEAPESGKLTRPVRAVRHSIGGMADLAPPRPSTRMSIGGLADLRGKENIKPRLERKPLSKPADEEVVKPEAPLFTVGLLPEGLDTSKPSLIRQQAAECFDLAFVEGMSSLLAAKVAAKKFDISSKDKEQTALIANLKNGILQLKTKQAEFIQGCMETEAQMAASAQAVKLTMDSVVADKEQVAANLQDSQARVVSLDSALAALEKEKTDLLTERTDMEKTNNELTTTKSEQEKKIEELVSELRQATKLAEFRNSELEKAREGFELKKKEIAEIQIAQRLSEVALQQTFNEKMDNLKSLLLDANTQNKTLQEGKVQYEQKLQEAAVKSVQQQGELEAERGKSGMTQTQLDRANIEIESLRAQLAEKGTQFISVMEGFQRSQKFHEERITMMCNEKKELDAKIWALQSKKEELESTLRDTTNKLEAVTKKGQEDKLQLEGALTEQTKQLAQVTADFALARENWAQTSQEAAERAKSTHESFTLQVETLNKANKQLMEDFSQSEGRVTVLTQNCQDATKQLELFKKHAGVDTLEQLERLCKVSVEAEYLRQQLSGKENLATKLQQTEANLKTVREQLFQAELARRNLHNQIQELKGNVRVYVRVRPTEEGEDAGIECEADSRSLNINSEEGKEHGFQFDHVWSSKANQTDVFNEVAPLVQSSLDGYNVCLFSYGQTGSGKTFTMQGANMGESRGIIPRSIEKIMEEAVRLGEQGWQYRLEVTFLEIYNENVRDLLLENSSEQSSLAILMHPDGGCHVPDLTRIEVTDRSQIDGIMRRAAKHRSVARTNMNSRSSRSHSVFTLHLTGVNESKNVTLKGSLNLCDLAGSERLDKSGATGERLKETQAINKSLSCLAGVFTSLASKNAHIPYRDSKLTYLLQHCFSAQGKTLMLVNLSPSSASYSESLCSLRFARQVNNVELGRPVANSTKRQSSAGLVTNERPPSPKRNRSSTPLVR